MRRSWRSCWPCPPCPPVVQVLEHLGVGTERNERPRTHGSWWGKGLLLDTETHIWVNSSETDFTWRLLKTSLPTSALTGDCFRPQRWEWNRQKTKDRQDHTGLSITCWWQTDEERTGTSMMKPRVPKGHLKQTTHVCNHAADTKVLQTNRSQKNSYKVKPSQNVCSAFSPDSPDTDSFAPKVLEIYTDVSLQMQK